MKLDIQFDIYFIAAVCTVLGFILDYVPKVWKLLLPLIKAICRCILTILACCLSMIATVIQQISNWLNQLCNRLL